MKTSKTLLRVEEKSASQRWAERKRAEGLCPRCGQERRDLNPRTGKPYLFGPHCRPVVAAEKKLQMQRWRASKVEGF